MRSIGSRLALWYALSSTAMLTLAVIAGYFLLERHLLHNLDAINQAEFEQLQDVLGPDFIYLEPEVMADRLRDATRTTAPLVYVEVRYRALGVVFATSNLQGQTIPDNLSEISSSIKLKEVGELRVSKFAIARMTVFICSSLAQAHQLTIGYLKVSAALVVVMAIISCGAGLGLSRIALRPIRIIQLTAERIGSDNLSERIPVGAVTDEISNLARLLNRTFDRLESAFNQVRLFTAEASHELKTPLALARAHAERLIHEDAAKDEQEEVQDLLEELTQLEKIIEELLLLSRAEAHAVPLEMRVLDAQQFVENFMRDALVLSEFRGVSIKASYRGDGEAEFDPKWIRQVLLNLLSNALHASARGNVITLVSTIDAKGWRIAMEDEGPGVPADQLDRIFERFFRLDNNEDDKGSGLGLAISRSIVNLHGGKIHAELPERGRGLRVVIELAVSVMRTRVVVDGNSLAKASKMAQ